MMSDLKLRFYLFILGCIGTRSLFTISAYRFSHTIILPILGIFGAIFALSWFYLIFIGRRDTGPEVFGGAIWWKSLRPVHMTLWGFFAYLALTRNPSAWMVLAVDTILGLQSFLFHHWAEGNLTKMMA
jgi:hypothetical protein